uniref:Uncharacterized protein n=1 Tax=Zea mays TaxID=4577 RepID=C0PNH7_MAIZE|nr:unknown [Zea mays]
MGCGSCCDCDCGGVHVRCATYLFAEDCGSCSCCDCGSCSCFLMKSSKTKPNVTGTPKGSFGSQAQSIWWCSSPAKGRKITSAPGVGRQRRPPSCRHEARWAARECSHALRWESGG